MSRGGSIGGAVWSALAAAGLVALLDVSRFSWVLERSVHPFLPLAGVLVYGLFGLACALPVVLFSRRLTESTAAAWSGSITGFLLCFSLLFMRLLPESVEVLTPAGMVIGLVLVGVFVVVARPWGRLVAAQSRSIRRGLALFCVLSIFWALRSQVGSPRDVATSENADASGILLLVLDTLRADRLAAYGSTEGVMPHLDRFAEESMVFTESISTSCHTPPPHASLLTGMYPRVHGVNDHQRRFSRENETVPEMLQDDDWYTFAVVANVQLQGFLGWDQGFDLYDESLISLYGVLDWYNHTPAILLAQKLGIPAEPLLAGSALRFGIFERPVAASVVDRALVALDDIGDQSFFGMLNFMDPHYPYKAPGTSLEADRINRQLRRVLALPGHKVETDEARAVAAQIPDLYDEEVRYLDRELGRFFDALRERGLLDRLWVIVTSDHGEHLGEYGRMLHANSLFRELVDVPLLVRAPAGASVAGIEPAPVSSVDVAATIVEAAGLEPPASMQGRSLLRPMGEDPLPAVVSEWQGHRVLAFDGGRGFFEDGELVRVVADGRDEDVVSGDPVLAQRARDLYGAWVERYDRAGVTIDDGDLDDALTRQLRTLGYVE